MSYDVRIFYIVGHGIHALIITWLVTIIKLQIKLLIECINRSS